MTKALLAMVLLSLFSCSHLGRQIASAPPQYSFKLYGTTKYLPRTVTIFKRNYTYEGQILVAVNRSLAVNERLTCTTSSYAPNNQFATQTYPVITETIIPLRPELNTVICEISNPAGNIELIVKYQPKLDEEFQKIEAMLSVLKLADLNAREMEPAIFCAGTQTTSKRNFLVSSKMNHGAVGEFCGGTAEVQPGIFAVACDAPRDQTWNGFVNLFNDKMLLIKKNKILSPQHDQDGFEFTNSVDHASKPIIINKVAIFTTNDGRMLYFTGDGTKVRELKMPFLYLSNPQMMAGSLDTFGVLGADSISNPEKKAILILQNNRLIKTVDVSLLNDVSSFQLFPDGIYLVTYLGEVIKMDHEGQILSKMQVEKNRLSPLMIQENRILVGSDSGRLYEIDRDLEEAKIIYRAFYDGRTDYDVGSNQNYAIRPNFGFTPGILKDGKIVMASVNDGRIHFLTSEGKLEKIVSVPFVRDLLGFSIFTTLDGDEYIAASSISYLEILTSKGDLVAESISTGAEIYEAPKLMKSGQYLMGMYNGVFRFKLDIVPGQNITTKFVRPCP